MPAVEMIQPIAVLKDPADPASHEEICLAAALASAAALAAFPEAELWRAWYASGRGKSVRRGRAKDLRAIEAEGAAAVQVGRARAAAQPPTTYPLTGRMRQLQVSGTEFQHTGESTTHGLDDPSLGHPYVTLYLDRSLGMSTGKAAAQAAHACFDWAADLEPGRFEEWMAAGQPSVLATLNARDLRRARRHATVEIHDAGHTEIAPGSLTALAR